MVLLDLADKSVRVQLQDRGRERARLTIDYPQEGPYHSRIMSALADLLRPEPSQSVNPKSAPLVRQDGRG